MFGPVWSRGLPQNAGGVVVAGFCTGPSDVRSVSHAVDDLLNVIVADCGPVWL